MKQWRALSPAPPPEQTACINPALLANADQSSVVDPDTPKVAELQFAYDYDANHPRASTE
jgi:hypothetical protein